MKKPLHASQTPLLLVLPVVLALNVSGEKAQAVESSSLEQVAQQRKTVSGVVTDEHGEPLIGVSIALKNSTHGTITDIDGRYSLPVENDNSSIIFSYVGYVPQTIALNGRKQLNVRLKEDTQTLGEVVVTAMGIMRKEKSLTYSTQQIKSEDLNKVQDANVANSIEGKISGVVITPSAGGAGGASKIVLRGNKSILGSSTPLIVVDGVPMTNNTRGQLDMNSGASLTYSGTAEGSDPLSTLNPDDIESINVLKGANAAALYGSAAANGVVMITTKKGKEGKMSVNFTSNLTFDRPLLTPDIQNVYGATVTSLGEMGDRLSVDSWGDKVSARSASNLVINVPMDETKFGGGTRAVYLRNSASDDLSDFYQTGVTTNNSIAVSGGTKNVQSYFSYGNAHANGMLESNSYNRNTFALRQNYEFYDRLHFDVSANYVQTVTRNRPGGGTVLNPIYHMYTMPRNLDIDYYRNNYASQGSWKSELQSVYVMSGGSYQWTQQRASLSGPMQNWAYMESMQNNPYWLMNQNSSKQNEDRFYGTVSGRLDLLWGLSFQARASIDHTKYTKDSRRYATTFNPSGMEDYGRYWKDIYKTNEIYTDYMLNYDRNVRDFSVSATAGWVGHVLKGSTQSTDVVATYVDPLRRTLSDRVNLFMTNAGGTAATTTKETSNWDKAALFTAQVGWLGNIYIDGSYRRDWYRAYKQFVDRGTPDNYGYFGFGATAIISQMVKMPEWWSYLKYRLSYSEVGNSIPNVVYAKGSENLATGTVTVSAYSRFANPLPEKTRSFETGIESQFFDNRLSLDLTYYNSRMQDLYMLATNASGLTEPVNSGKVRNQGIEATLAYNFAFGRDWTWRTSYNISFNDNKILETSYEEDGSEKLIYQDVAGVRVRYRKGGSIGDMYVTDFKRDDEGHYVLSSTGRPQLETEANKAYTIYAGNMNSKWQMGWSNTVRYKNLSLFFLINGRIGGKVISLTEAYLDNLGLSERTSAARLHAEANNIVATTYGNEAGMVLPDGSGRIVPIKAYYQALGSTPVSSQYLYNGTNFRLRELSLGYTFRNLFGENKSLTLSAVARNLFFLYKDCPTDPDVSLSTTNGLSAFELFNMPSARSFGFSLNVNF
jgi:TonB-linked SusC/RagA family outer membrane protein